MEGRREGGREGGRVSICVVVEAGAVQRLLRTLGLGHAAEADLC